MIKRVVKNKNPINTETGELYFGNNEYISSKTTFDEIKKMKGIVDSVFENAENGIQSLAFFNKEIDGNFYQISFHFHFGKLSMIFIEFKDGKQLLGTDLWGSLKQIKTNKHSKKGDVYKSKNFDWGRIHSFYALRVNLGQFHISYKR